MDLTGTVKTIRQRLMLDRDPFIDMPDDLIVLAFLSKLVSNYSDALGLIYDLKKKYGLYDYEYLEFMGDRILETITLNIIIDTVGISDPGTHSVLLSNIVRNLNLSCLMNNKGLCELVIKPKIVNMKDCADVLESVIGTLYYYLRYMKGQTDYMEEITDWFEKTFDISGLIRRFEKGSYPYCNNKLQVEPVLLKNYANNVHKFIGNYFVGDTSSVNRPKETEKSPISFNENVMTDKPQKPILAQPILAQPILAQPISELNPVTKITNLSQRVRNIKLVQGCNIPFSPKALNLMLPVGPDYERFQQFIKIKSLTSHIKYFYEEGEYLGVLYLTDRKSEPKSYVCADGSSLDMTAEKLLRNIINHFSLSDIPSTGEIIKLNGLYPPGGCDYPFSLRLRKIRLPTDRSGILSDRESLYLRYARETGIRLDGRYVFVGRPDDYQTIGVLYLMTDNDQIPIYCTRPGGFYEIEFEIISFAIRYMSDLILNPVD